MVYRKLDKLKYMIAKKKNIYIYIYITVNRLLLSNRSLIVEHCSGSNGELPGFVYFYINIYIYIYIYIYIIRQKKYTNHIAKPQNSKILI